MKKQIFIYLVGTFLCTLIIPLKAQTIWYENGANWSKLNTTSSILNSHLDFFKHPLHSYQTSINVDYINHEWFYLSSGIGYIRKGGEEHFNIADEGGNILQNIIHKENIDYLSFRTTFNIQYQVLNIITPYIGVGPRLDCKINSFATNNENIDANIQNYVSDHYLPKEKLNNVDFGLQCVAGLRSHIGKFQFGVHFSYQPSFTKLYAPTSKYYIRNQAFTLGAFIGYKIK